jgi:hypothetical protein
MSERQSYSIGWDTRPDHVRATQVLKAAALLVLARLALIVLGFHRTARLVDRISRADKPQADVGPAQVQASAYVVSLAAAFVPARVLCLERSLVLYYKLKGTGAPVALWLGVRAFPFAAHAWVEFQGTPINETPDNLKDFAPILELGR